LQKKLKKTKTQFKINWSLITLFILILMIVYGIVWEVVFDPLRDGSLLWLKILPLVLCLPGTFKKNIRVLQWLSLLVWFYVCEALVRITSDPQETIFYSILWLMLSLSLTFATWIAVRSKRKLTI
jgi:uncharacterized membrane protein